MRRLRRTLKSNLLRKTWVRNSGSVKKLLSAIRKASPRLWDLIFFIPERTMRTSSATRNWNSPRTAYLTTFCWCRRTVRLVTAATLCFSRTGSRWGFSTFMAWCTPLLTDGNIISKGSYSQNEKDGEWIIYFETDNKYYRKGLYKNGKKQGVWGLYLADNTLINEEKF